MRSEESRLLAFVQERFNTSILAGEPLDGHAALMAAIHDLSVISDERRAALTKSISARVKSRAVHAASIRRRIEKRYGQVLAAFDECIAAAEELNARLVDNFGRGVPGEERGGASVRRYGRELMVGGATLKILLLTGLQARACMTATEVGFLLRAGLPQAADSRTRSLYEQTIVSMILSNDQTYEICERYHDSASIEALRYMRSHNLHAEQLGWEPIRNEELRDAERFAALAVKNWGPEIRTLYGWASPLVPHVRPGKLRFTDLERIVEGEMLRPGYLRLNHSIHAGPSSVIGQTDFQTPHLMITRPTADDGDFGATLSWTLHLLFMTTDLSAHSVTLLTERYDDYLEVGEFVRRAEAVLSLLEGGLLSVQDSTRRG